MKEISIVSSHYNEDLSWLINQDSYPYFIYSKNAEFVKRFLDERPHMSNRVKLMENKGNEAGSYLSFIIENYENLPDHVAFVHGHDRAWHQGKSIYDYLSAYDGENYLPLSDTYFRNVLYRDDNQHGGSLLYSHMDTLWKDVPEIALPFPDRLELTMCAQFVVPKKAILKNNVFVYRKLLSWLFAQTHMSQYRSAILFEQLWYYLMTHQRLEPRSKSRNIADERGFVSMAETKD